MNEHEKAQHKPDRKHRGPHVEPSRLQQVEDALHRLSKKVGKLNREQRDMKADFESELAELKKTRRALAREVEELKKLRSVFERELANMSKKVEGMAGDDEPDDEPDPPYAGDDEPDDEPDPPYMLAGDDEPDDEPDPPY